MNSSVIISIEGNIGSGKSTLLANLKQELGNNKKIVFLREPVDEWESIIDKNGNTMLQKFYLDQEKYSFSFQMMAYISRLALLKDAVKNNPNSIIITERSLLTDKMVFAKMLFESGKIEDVNYEIYLKWFHTFADDFAINKIIYVCTNPEICHKRIAKRSRNGESSIPLDYLIDCHVYHNNMLGEIYTNSICKDQMFIDGDVDIYENREQIDEWIKNIKKFIGI